MIVDMNLILTISGIVITILIGYLGIKYSLKAQKKVSLCFIEKDFLPLVKKISKSFDTINISYENKPISESLILLKGCILNDGNCDIDKAIIHKPLEMGLPDGYKFVEVKQTDCSENINAVYNIDNEKLVFNWDLLKSNEFFSFDVLIEANTVLIDNNSSKKLKKVELKDFYQFNHRITNLKELNKVDLYQIRANNRKSNFNKWFFRAILPIGLVFILFSFIKRFDYKLDYFLEKNGNIIEVELKPIDMNKINVKSKIDTINYVVRPDELFKNNSFKVGIKKDLNSFWLLLILGLLYSILGTLMIFDEVKLFKQKRIMNIITQPNTGS